MAAKPAGASRPRAPLDNGSSSYTQTGSWTSQSGGFSGTYSTAAGGSQQLGDLDDRHHLRGPGLGGNRGVRDLDGQPEQRDQCDLHDL